MITPRAIEESCKNFSIDDNFYLSELSMKIVILHSQKFDALNFTQI